MLDVDQSEGCNGLQGWTPLQCAILARAHQEASKQVIKIIERITPAVMYYCNLFAVSIHLA